MEKHQISFAALPGDPGSYISLCFLTQIGAMTQLMVEESFGSVSFIRHAKKTYTKWLYDLLRAAWEICRTDTDVIIENPANMGTGVHISEKLRVSIQLQL